MKPRFKKGPDVAGVIAWIMIGGHEDVDRLDFSGINIHEDYAAIDPDSRLYGSFVPVGGVGLLDVGPVQMIPIIIPWEEGDPQ